MSLPTVAIVGRPNVGKSSLFNSLIRSRVSIVDPTAGVTRDRVSALLKAGSRRCELVDTGGIGVVDKAGLEEEIETQIQIAMHQADVVLLLVDVREGLLPLDEEIARRLRRLDKCVVLVANKCDGPGLDPHAGIFAGLGFGDALVVAADSGRNVGDLRERIEELLPEQEAVADEEDVVHIALVGRTNSGKSTLVNHLVGAERMIVSEVPGTTRDAVDLHFERGARKFVAVDTAGLRKTRSVDGSPDFYGQARTERAIRRSHVVLFLVDATQPVSRIERMIGQRIIDAHRPAVLVVSKWDLAHGRSVEEYGKYLRKTLPFLSFAPIAVLSATEGFHVDETLELAAELYDQAGRRMTTSEINYSIKEAMARKGPPTKGGRTGKIYFATQTGVHPPTIVLFVNDFKMVGKPYLRYLTGRLREMGVFPEVPVRMLVRDRQER